MVTIGVDAHRRMLFVVLVDDQGQERQHWQLRNTRADWTAVLAEVEELSAGDVRQWGIEGSGHAGRGLAQLLVSQQEVVYEINPRLTAQSRARSRRRDKSDHADALAIARLVVQEAGQLPRIWPDDATTPLALLTQERDRLQVDLTRLRNRLHADLVVFEPIERQHLPKLTTRAGLETLLAWDEARLGLTAQIQLQRIQRQVRRMLGLTDDLETVSAQLRTLSRPVCGPLRELVGIGALHAGMLAGYLGPGQRFASDAQLARYAGVAPLEVSSAGRVRHRLNRTGHRKLNEIIHRIALVQAQRYAPAKAYLARRQAEGKTWREAMRALKRYIVRAIFQAWTRCLAGTVSPADEGTHPHALT
jgi:transposase